MNSLVLLMKLTTEFFSFVAKLLNTTVFDSTLSNTL